MEIICKSSLHDISIQHRGTILLAFNSSPRFLFAETNMFGSRRRMKVKILVDQPSFLVISGFRFHQVDELTPFKTIGRPGKFSHNREMLTYCGGDFGVHLLRYVFPKDNRSFDRLCIWRWTGLFVSNSLAIEHIWDAHTKGRSRKLLCFGRYFLLLFICESTKTFIFTEAGWR